MGMAVTEDTVGKAMKGKRHERFVGLYAIQFLSGRIFMLLIAFIILEHNWAAFKQVGGFGGRR